MKSYLFTYNQHKHFILFIYFFCVCDPMDCSPPGSSDHGILQARILEWVVISFSKHKRFSYKDISVSSLQSFSRVWLSGTQWTAALQASLTITNSQSLLKLMPIESMMPSNHLILCPPLLLPPSIFPSIMVFSNESVLHIR